MASPTFFLISGVVVVIGVLVVMALVRFLGGRVGGRAGNTETFWAQVEAQMFSSRGWRRRAVTPPWDGEDRMAAPNTDLVF